MASPAPGDAGAGASGRRSGVLHRTAWAAAWVVAVAACAGVDPGLVSWGPHVDGLRHGFWRFARPGGWVEEGHYAGGRLHGEWVLRDPSGAVVSRELWCRGQAAEPGQAACD